MEIRNEELRTLSLDLIDESMVLLLTKINHSFVGYGLQYYSYSFEIEISKVIRGP